MALFYSCSYFQLKQRRLKMQFLLRKKVLKMSLVLLLSSFLPTANALSSTNTVTNFVQVTQGIPNFGGISNYKDNQFLIGGYNKNVRLFSPHQGKFIESLLVLSDNNFSYPNDMVFIPAHISGIGSDAIVAASFLDGRVVAKKGNQPAYVVQSDANIQTAPDTGANAFTYDFNLQLIQGIAYRKKDNMVYTQSAADPTQIWKLDWTHSGVTPVSIRLSQNAILNYFNFGTDDKIYGADVFNKQLVRVNPDSGQVDFLLSVPTIVAAKIDSKGMIYYLDRSTGLVGKFNTKNNHSTTITTLAPALTDLAISTDETKLYVTNDQSTIYEIEIATGTTKVIYSSPVVGPWDLAYSSDDNLLYVADNGSLKAFDHEGKIKRTLVTDASTSGLVGFGLIAGIQVEDQVKNGNPAEIVLSDNTVGNVAVVYKKDFKVKTQFSPNDTGLLQVFSAVHVTNVHGEPNEPSEFYLAVNPFNFLGPDFNNGSIVKLWRESYPNGKLHFEPWFTGLAAPSKLKVKDGFIYVVESGQLLSNTENSGIVSRIPIRQHPAPSDKQVLQTGLNNPQGLDFFDDKMLIVEAAVNKRRILQASALVPSLPKVVQENLLLSNGNLIYQFAPINIHPFKGLACTPSGKQIWAVQDQEEVAENIILITRLTTE